MDQNSIQKDLLVSDGLKIASTTILAVKNGRISEAINDVATMEIQKEGFGINFEQAIVLFLLYYHKGLTQKAIAESLDKDSPSITRLIDVLEEADMLERRNDPIDRRAKQIYLTKVGEKIVPDLVRISQKAFSIVFEGVPSEQIKMMQDILCKMLENADNYKKVNAL